MSDRLADLFGRALDLSGTERESFLQQECADDRALHTQLCKLLADDERANCAVFIAGSALDTEARASAEQGLWEPSGTLFERYRIESLIGEGGMGEVYRAYDTELNRVVAVKTVRGFVGTDELLRRFGNERQILAHLNHDYIARLFDIGATAEGRPFLVMEFVDGIPVHRFVEQHKLSIDATLELFAKICAAVAYAHQNLVVHRDLKPANILVTADGTPKLLDFGIAKLLDGSGSHTGTGMGALTPEYASPEQVRGEAIGTASDVYSLGVLLHQLLSGGRPYKATTGPLDLAQAICAEPPLPLAAHGKSFDADLENIVQLALRKEPERRYASVEQFGADIQRYRGGYPVAARPDTRGYRAAKFVRRNRVLAGASALLVLALLGGLAATAWQARIAERRFNNTRKLANSLITQVDEAVRDLPGATRARETIVKLALDYLDELSNERGSDRALRRELANAYGKVGDVQGAPNTPSLGDSAGALATYRKAVAIMEPLAAAAPRDPDIGVELGRAYSRAVALVLRGGDMKTAMDYLQKEIAIDEKMAVLRPEDTAIADELAMAYTGFADVSGNIDVSNLGKPRESIRLFEKALKLREMVATKNPENKRNRMALAGLYGRMGSVKRSLRDTEGAIQGFHQAIEMNEQLVREDPLSVMSRREIAVYGRTLGMTLSTAGRLQEARQSGDYSHEIFLRLAELDPANAGARQELGDSYVSQSKLLSDSGELQQAKTYIDNAIATYKLARGSSVDGLRGMRNAYLVRGEIDLKRDDPGAALDDARKQLAIADEMLAINAQNSGARHYRGLAMRDFGHAHEYFATHATGAKRMSEWHEAQSWYQKSLDVWDGLKKSGSLLPIYAPEHDRAEKSLDRCAQAINRARD